MLVEQIVFNTQEQNDGELNMYEKGSFVKWTSTDEEGSFSFVGQVKSFVNHTYLIDTEYGMMGIPEDDGSLIATTKPKNWLPPKNVAPHRPVVVKEKRTRVPRGNGPTKAEQALSIVREMFGQGKDVIIQRIIDECSMSKAGATTYYYNAKKVIDKGE